MRPHDAFRRTVALRGTCALALSLGALLTACAPNRPPEERMSYAGQRLYPPPPAAPQAQGPAPRAGYSKDRGYRQRHAYQPPYVQAAPGTADVRSNEVVHAYGVGRYVDPGDCRIMHERHAVYRLEERAGWKLQDPPNRPVVVGPIVGLRRPEYAPEPLRGEVSRDLAATKAKLDAAASGVEAVARDQVLMRQQLEENARRVNQNQQYIEGQ
ncbi:MAG: hypothetical protein JO069_02295, partial [Verrucomicrobia bacterium]|nr:hypothetical protein [Verrucomicrobiota bacterium]